MLKDRNEQIQTGVRLLDAVVCVAAFFGAYWIRTHLTLPSMSGWSVGIGPVESLGWMLAASLLLHFMLYPYMGFYHSIRLKSVTHIVSMVLKAGVIEFFILGTLVFLMQAKDTSRYFFGLFLAMNYVLILVQKVGARIFLSAVRRRGYNFRQVLIAGTGQNAQSVIQTLRRNKDWGYVACGLLREKGDTSGIMEIDGVPVVGELANLSQVVRERPVDEIYFAPDRIDAAEIADEFHLSQKLGIPARFSLGFFGLIQSRVTFANLDNLPVVTFYTTLMTPAEATLKRLMDIVVALIGLTITAVLYPWISWRIRKESPGPVIFKGVRVGENGRRFKCYKFRTMALDAEARKADLAASNFMDGPIFKIENDPRVLQFGSFLRRTSLDELPQFFNILRGDMSVVGTRPPTPDEVSQYQTHFRRRLSIRPGLTGLWQVSGRNQVRKFEEILALDLEYIDTWSIWLDIKIILRTIWITLFRRGAY